jgi:SHS2 domain-containing protein
MQKRKNYKYIEHTADVEYVAYGKSLVECFRNALMAMFDTQSYQGKVMSSKSKSVMLEIKDSAKSIKDLLWYTLQDTLSLADSKAVFPYRVSSMRIASKGKSYMVNAKILAREKEDRSSKLDVKGVARYNLDVKQSGKRFEAHVVLDV